MPAEIPPDQLARIQPILSGPLREVRRLALELADDADSALIYAPEGEDAE